MAIEIQWVVSTLASTLHAAGAMLRGATLVDKKVSCALAEEVERLRGDLVILGLPAETLWEHLVPASVRFDVPFELSQFALGKLLGPRPDVDAVARLSRRLISLSNAFHQANPRALEELELRSEPLRSQWEARGPGLMATVGRLTESELIVGQADVILVQPVLGGGGTAHWLYNSVSIEAVLANPISELPEVVRLGWLLAQLNLDLPKYQDDFHRDRLRQVGPLALLPAILMAASEVELVRDEPSALSTALFAWNLNAIEPGQLMAWWDTYQASNPPWSVALGALERMLPSSAEPDANESASSGD